MTRITQKTSFFLLFFILQSTFGADQSYLQFPKNLTFGVASSAYQTEGAWNVDGKSPSNWDEYTHSLPNGSPNADVAADSYHHYKEDIEIVHDTGFDNYRISLSWPRILPAGIGNDVNMKAIEYYKQVLDEIHAKNITPQVTLSHWDLPLVISEYGGWTNSSIIDHISNYAKIVFQHLGSRVKFWTTLNEPRAYCDWGYGKGYFPIGKVEASKANAYKCGENALKAHAEIYHLYNDYFRVEGGQIGLVETCWNFVSKSDEPNDESADIAFQYNCGWLMNPIFSKSGDYPEVMKQRIAENSKLEGLKESRLPTLSPEWIERIKGSSDYFGLNYYTARMSANIPRSPGQGWFDDIGVSMTENSTWPVDAAPWQQIYPQGLGDLLRKIKKEYDNPPVYILENGLATDGGMVDTSRINFLYNHIKEVLIAINRDDCDVRAFTVWSLLDGYEWLAGYNPTMGLMHVDHKDPKRPRKPRLSAHWLQEVLKNRKLITLQELYGPIVQFIVRAP